MKTINLGGKDRPVLYNINALADFNEATGTNLEWIFRIASNPLTMTFNQMRWLVFVGLQNGAMESNEVIKVDYTIRDVGKWLTDEFDKFRLFMEVMKDSLPVKDEESKNRKGPKKSGQ